MLLIVSVISGCSKEKTINETTEKDTGVITETTAETETTTEKVVETEAPTTQSSGSGNGGSSSGGNNYTPTQAPTKAPETTKKQETKPVVNQNDDVEVKDKDREEVPTYADGSFDMGAMIDKTEEEEGPGGYF